MPGVPRLVRLAVPRSLAGLCATRTLSPAHPRVGQKPSSAYATRSLLAHGARDHRRPRAWPPATDTTDHAQPLPQPPPTTCTAAGHGPPPTTPSRRPRPPPTTPSCCRSAQWVTSDEQPRVTSRKRRSAGRIQMLDDDVDGAGIAGGDRAGEPVCGDDPNFSCRPTAHQHADHWGRRRSRPECWGRGRDVEAGARELDEQPAAGRPGARRDGGDRWDRHLHSTNAKSPGAVGKDGTGA